MRLGSKGGKGKGKGRSKGKSDRAKAAYDEDDEGYEGSLDDSGRWISELEWIAHADDWTAEECLGDPEYSWMVDEYYDQHGRYGLDWTEAGARAFEDFVWLYEPAEDDSYEGSWIEPVAYARDTGTRRTDSTVVIEEVETEGTRKVRDSEEASSSSSSRNARRAPVVLGGLGEAMKWRPDEPNRRASDVESVRAEEVEMARSSREAPKPERWLGRGWNLEVLVSIGDLPCAVLMDSGASRNIIKASFRRSLQNEADTKSHVLGPYQGERKISIAGIHSTEGLTTGNDISKIVDVTFRFRRRDESVGPSITVQFGEMESSADDLLVGNPQMFEWGFTGYYDKETRVPKFHLMKPQVELEIVRWYPNPQLKGTVAGLADQYDCPDPIVIHPAPKKPRPL